MADVDPFEGLIGIGGQISSVEDLMRIVVELQFMVYQLRERTGGDTDAIENIEFTVTTQDGGNRSMIRRFRDEIDELKSLIACIPRPKDNSAEIDEIKSLIARIPRQKDYNAELQYLQSEIAETKRHNRQLESLTYELRCAIDSVKRQSKASDQEIYELSTLVNQNKRYTKSLEQQVSELESRIDSGV